MTSLIWYLKNNKALISFPHHKRDKYGTQFRPKHIVQYKLPRLFVPNSQSIMACNGHGYWLQVPISIGITYFAIKKYTLAFIKAGEIALAPCFQNSKDFKAGLGLVLKLRGGGEEWGASPAGPSLAVPMLVGSPVSSRCSHLFQNACLGSSSEVLRYNLNLYILNFKITVSITESLSL